jgi:hypothetical protein
LLVRLDPITLITMIKAYAGLNAIKYQQLRSCQADKTL